MREAWGLDTLADRLSSLGLGLALAGVANLRDHWEGAGALAWGPVVGTG